MFRKKPEQRVNTDGTAQWRKKTSNNRRLTSMRESLLKMKSTVLTTEHADLIAATELPADYDMHDPEDINGWLAENVVEFFSDVHIMYQLASQQNEEWYDICTTTKEAGFPPGVLYLWKDSSTEKPVRLSADKYIEEVFNWVDSVLSNEEIFPPDEEVEFPSNFRKYIKKMMTRLFRTFIIIRANKCLRERTDKGTLKSSFCLFLYFGWHWELLPLDDPKEAKAISDIMEPIRARYINELQGKPTKKVSRPPLDRDDSYEF